MKKTLSLFLALVMAVGIFCSVPFTQSPLKLTADAASKSDLKFEFDDWDGGSYSVTGCSKSASGSLTIPATYNGSPVTSIGEYAFSDCTGLTSVTIPNSVTEIGRRAFDGCTGLTSVTIPDSVTSIYASAFEGCTSLTSITIPNSVTEIGWSAFEGCTGLTSITIPNSVTEIGWCAFEGCTGLTSVTIPDSVTEIGGYAFSGCTGLTSITIPNSVTEIGDYVFSGCTGLTSVTIPDSVTEIGNYAFSGCTGLTSVTIPDSVTSIYDGAFYGCTGLTSITIPNSVTEIGYGAFEGCTGLTSITIPNSVTEISYGAFEGCTGLTSVTIPDSVTEIGSYAFSGCKGLTSITIPNSVTEIGYGAFYGCTGLTSVTIPDSVTSIYDGAFEGCTSLTSITIPDSVTKIGRFAFNDTGYYNKSSNWKNGALYIGNHLVSTNEDLPSSYTIKNGTKTIAGNAFEYSDLTSVTIPDSVVSIGDDAFSDSYNLTSIKIPDSVTNIGRYAFYDTGYYNKSSNWKNGALYIGNHLVSTNEDLPSSYTIKNGTKTIAGNAFAYSVLTSVTIPDSVVSIGDDAFAYSDLTTIYGKTNSAAHIYAKENYIEFVTVTKPGTVKLSGATNASTGVKVSWSKVDDISLYTLYRKSGSSSWKAIKSNIIGTSYTDTTAKSGTKYTYTVRATNVAGTGGYDKTGKTVTYLAMPKPSVTNASNGVTVKWSKVTGAKEYYVYRKSGNSGWKKIGTSTGTSYTDKTAKSGTSYTYTVRAYNGKTSSAYNTKGLSIKFLATPKLSSIANSTSGVTVKWGKVTGAKEYYVYRKSGNSGWKKIATSTGTSYTDKTAKSGTSYTYTVRAYNGKTSSAYNTKGLAIKFLATPKLSSVTSAKSGVTFKWGKVTGASGYYVYRKTGNGGWQKVATVKGNSKVSYLDKSAKKGTTYTYTVRAYNGKTLSAYNTKGLKIKDKY